MPIRRVDLPGHEPGGACAWGVLFGYDARMMLSPSSRSDMRRYFCEVYAKWCRGDPLDAMEALLSAWMQEHPEYHAALAQPQQPTQPQLQPQSLQGHAPQPEHADSANPFLHLSMHLALSEQCSIDQPHGIRQAMELLAARLPSLHDAHHAAMDCLGEMIAHSQRTGQPLDGDGYLACVQRKATRI